MRWRKNPPDKTLRWTKMDSRAEHRKAKLKFAGISAGEFPSKLQNLILPLKNSVARVREASENLGGGHLNDILRYESNPRQRIRIKGRAAKLDYFLYTRARACVLQFTQTVRSVTATTNRSIRSAAGTLIKSRQTDIINSMRKYEKNWTRRNALLRAPIITI